MIDEVRIIMVERIQCKIIVDDNGYITDIFLMDNNNILSKWNKPIRIDITVLKLLSRAIDPIIKYADERSGLHGQHMNDVITTDEFNEKVKELQLKYFTSEYHVNQKSFTIEGNRRNL